MKRGNDVVEMNDSEGRVVFTDSLTLKFEGENVIDVQELLGYMSGFNCAYQAYLDSEYHSPSMRLQVVAIQQGSFELILQSVVALAPDLLTNLPVALSSFKTLMEIIKLKKALKGKEPQKVENDGDQSKITNHEGEVTYHNCTVTNIYLNNPSIDEGLTKAFHALQVSSPRNAVHLTSGQHSLVVGKDDYSNMAEHIISKVNDDTTQVRTIETKLKIRKLDFIGDTMWSFVDENNKNLTATIEDENFSRKVKTGEIKLSANDVLFVRLRIEAPVDKYMNVGRKRFYIEAVLKYDTPIQVEQLRIPLPD